MNADDAQLLREFCQRINDQLAAANGVIEASDFLHDSLLRRDGDVLAALDRYRTERRIYTLLVANSHTALDSDSSRDSELQDSDSNR